jgi:hypothetical protein
MHAHRLRANAADARAVIGGLVMHQIVLDDVEFGAEALGHVAGGVGELVDDGVEERHRGGKALAGFDGAATVVHRVRRRAAGADQKPLGHHEAHAHQRFAGLRHFLLQVRHHADDFLADDVEPHVLVGADQRVAGKLRHRRVLRNPDAATRVGE